MPEETGGRILVVDANRVSRVALSRAVRELGHVTDMAEDGAQALGKMRSEPFDVVLLDILMPEMDSFAVLDAMRRDPGLRDIPVIVVSAVEDVDNVVRCIEMGAVDYLAKPFDRVLLRARLRQSLQRKRFDDLQRAYVQQETTLRQSEKLATLGRLSAGVAHELNNPAAAAVRGAQQVQEAFERLRVTAAELAEAGLWGEDITTLGDLMASRTAAAGELDPLERSDQEEAFADWLLRQGVADGWKFASVLVDGGLKVADLEDLARRLRRGQLSLLLRWLTDAHTVRAAVAEVRSGAARIAEIVGAMKRYSFLDRGTMHSVDVHEGLEDTLVVLRSRLRSGITVRRFFAEDLPAVMAAGGELNQVWTNLIDNAVDALDGSGTIVLRTRAEDDMVAVEIEDHGPGMDADLLGSVFDPFVTTKPPGKGTGLGLNIVHTIVTEHHHGRIDVESEPGRTVFTVRLPVRPPVDPQRLREDLDAVIDPSL